MDHLAFIFDYDDTIVPDSTSQLLVKYGINPKKFWDKDFKKLIQLGYEPTIAYLNLIVQNIGDGKKLGNLTNDDLYNFGKEVQKSSYLGIFSLINDLKNIVNDYGDISIEFHIFSSGLEQIILGNTFIKKQFKGVYACKLGSEHNTDTLKYIKRVITFTEKTRFIFEISKGISQSESESDPYCVNKIVKRENRKIPLKNMFYVGDGLTDIPCFSIINDNDNGGSCFGILHSDKTASAKRKIYKEIIAPHRTLGGYAPRYGKNSSLGSLIRLAVDARCAEILVQRKTSS